MAAWGKAMLAVALVVIPGGLVIALAWGIAKAFSDARERAQLRAGNEAITVRDVWREVKLPRLASVRAQA